MMRAGHEEKLQHINLKALTSDSDKIVEVPKSVTFMCPLATMSMFSGFKSN